MRQKMSHTHPGGWPFTPHIYPSMKDVSPTHTLYTHSGGKETSRSQDQMKARCESHSALTLGLVPRQGKSWSGASGRRMR